MTCSWCHDAPPLVVVVDVPELEAALMFGDLTTRRPCCAACLAGVLADGPALVEAPSTRINETTPRAEEAPGSRQTPTKEASA